MSSEAARDHVDHVPRPAPATPPRALRRDAVRNRERIVEAAHAVFAEHGLEVPMEEIARRAGVGVGTVYRRFGTRQELVEAVFLCKVAKCVQAAQEAMTATEGWTGFATYIEHLFAEQVVDRSLCDVLTLTLPDCPMMIEMRDRLNRAQFALIKRAQAEGSLRPDIVPEDILLLLFAHAGLVQATADAAPGAWRRVLGLMLNALRADGAQPLPDPPPREQLLAAFREPRPGRRPGSVGCGNVN